MTFSTKSPFVYSAFILLTLLAAGAAYIILTPGRSVDQSTVSEPTSGSTGPGAASSPSLDRTGKAPDFQLQRMNGETFRLSDHFGKVIVLNFWATWCPPCRKEIPDFIDMQNKYGKEGLLFVGVAEDKEGWKVVRPFARKMDINYPIVVDDGAVASRYGGIRGLPTSFIIGRDGEIHHVVPGMMRRDLLESELTKLLASADG